MQYKNKGYLYATIASVCYGLNPLFALPLYSEGLTTFSVLFYRYSLALIGLALLMKLRHEKFGISGKEFWLTTLMALLFAASSYTLFLSFRYIDAGIASTILFTYPIFVAVIQRLFFKERIGWIIVLSIALAFIGVALLYRGEGGATLDIWGVVLVIISAITDAFYLIGVNRSVLKKMSGIKLSFYVAVVSVFFFFILLHGGRDLQMLTTPTLVINAVGLSIFPTLISIAVITQAIHIIGSTPVSIFGALEALTALLVSVFVFDGKLTFLNIIGIALILFSVIMVVLKKDTGQIEVNS